MIESEGFAVIGDEAVEELVDHGRGGPGNQGAFDEVLFEEAKPDSWERGAEVGSATGHYIVTPGGHAVYTVVLHLGDAGTLVAAGRLPYDRSLGNGWIAVTGGTGNFQDARGRLQVDFKNPKRYTYPA